MEELDMQEIHQRIGLTVAKYRKNKSMSQLELSLALGHKSVSIVASGERCYRTKHFNIEHLVKISRVLKVPVSTFFEDVEENVAQ